MKNPFQTPEIKVICFEVEDVITVSLFTGMTEGGDGGEEGGGSSTW